MVKIPSFPRRTAAPTREEDRDGRVDERDARPVDGTARVSDDEPDITTRSGTTLSGDEATYRGRTAGATALAEPATRTDTRRAADRETVTPARGRGIGDREVTEGAVGTATPVEKSPVTDRTGTPTGDRVPDVERERDVVVPAGPRPRASLLATLSLIFGVAAALFVLTGTLAGYGIGLGAVALLLAIGGLSATGRRHVAGKSDAMIGLLLGLGAVLVGVLAMTGQFDWPNTDGDTVQRFREWLDSQFVDRF